MRLGAFLVLCTIFVPALTQAQLQWSKQTNPTPANFRVERGDFTGDGYPDLLLFHGGSQKTISILPNKGDGTFDSTRTFTLQQDLADVTVLDFNHDGNLDVAGCNEAHNNLVILLGAGDGTLSVEKTISTPCEWVTSADFNGDGFVDIAMGIPSVLSPTQQNQVVVFLGDGTGGVSSQVTNNIDNGCGLFESFGKAADFNSDKKADLAIIAGCPNGSSSGFLETLVVGIGDNTGHFAFHKDQQYNNTASEIVVNIRLGDVDQSGQIDVIGTAVWFNPPSGPGGGALIAFMGHGDGTFGFKEIAGSTTANGIGDVIGAGTVADFDGDGIKDGLVAVDSYNSSGTTTHSLRFYKGQANGSYTLTQTSSLATPAIDLDWADFDKKGRVDLVLVRPTSTDVWLNQTASAPVCGGAPRTMVVCFFNDGAGMYRFTNSLIDNLQVVAIQIYVDGSVKFQTLDDFLSTKLPLTNGLHRVTVKNWDAQGALSATVSFTACASSGNRTVTICSPQNGAAVGDGWPFVAAATTSLGLKSLQLYVDGTLTTQTTDQTLNYALLGLTPGVHHLTAKGWDSSGAFSSSLNFSVK